MSGAARQRGGDDLPNPATGTLTITSTAKVAPALR